MSHVSYFRYTFKLTHFFNRYTRSCIFYRSYGTSDYGAAKRPNSSNHQSVCHTASCSCNCYHCHCCCKIGSYPAGGDDLLYVFSLSRSALCAASSRRLVRYCRGVHAHAPGRLFVQRGTADAQNPGQSQDRNVFRKMRTQILPCHGVGGPAALMRT